MAYRTKVEVRTGGKVFKPGSILPENISKVDIDFLKSKKFVDIVEISDIVKDAEKEVDEEMKSDSDDMFDEAVPGSFKTAEEIKKMKSKKEIAEYADSIGLDLGDDYESIAIKDLRESVLNYQEELESGEVEGE